MHYITILVLLKHLTKPHQKVKVTHPHKPDVTTGDHTIRSHVVYILAMQQDPIDTPFEILDLYHKEI